MTQEHPITPPPELAYQWRDETCSQDTIGAFDDVAFATRAARWGADQELNECCKWLPKLPPWSADDLRKHRRPKPPSLKQQAIEALQRAEEGWRPIPEDCDIIRRALEALPE